MTLNAYRGEAGDFLKNADLESSASNPAIIEMLDNEFEILKSNLENPGRLSHQIHDMMFLLFELAAVNNFNLDAEWGRGKEKKRKYSPLITKDGHGFNRD